MKKLFIFCFLIVYFFSFYVFVSNSLALSSNIANEMKQDSAEIAEVGLGEAPGEGNLLIIRIGNAIKGTLGLIGIAFVCIIVYAGFLWMTSGGDTKSVEKAKGWMINTTIGLVILLSAYAISAFVINALLKASN